MSDVTNHLCQLLQDRDALGQKKYGTSLDRTDLTAEQWIQHTIEKLLDAAGYLEALKRKLSTQSPPNPPIAETIAGLRELPKLIGGREWHVNHVVDSWSVWTQPEGHGGNWLDYFGNWHEEGRASQPGKDMTATFPTREHAEAFVRILPNGS